MKRARYGDIAGKIEKLKAGKGLRLVGRSYGSIRTTLWRMRDKYPGRVYRCHMVSAKTIRVFRDK